MKCWLLLLLQLHNTVGPHRNTVHRGVFWGTKLQNVTENLPIRGFRKKMFGKLKYILSMLLDMLLAVVCKKPIAHWLNPEHKEEYGC